MDKLVPDKKKIAIIEDSEYMLLLLREIVTKLGYSAFEIDLKGDVINQLLNINPDIILLDIILSDMNGLEMLRKFSVAKLSFNGFVISSMGNELLIDKAFGMGVAAYLVKPITSLKLEKAINDLTSTKKMNSQHSKISTF